MYIVQQCHKNLKINIKIVIEHNSPNILKPNISEGVRTLKTPPCVRAW
jgi:hypothetical protein